MSAAGRKAAGIHDALCRCRACKPPLVGESRGDLSTADFRSLVGLCIAVLIAALIVTVHGLHRVGWGS